MNEADTRAELIEPKLRSSGWGLVEGSKVLREYRISEGKIQSGGRGKGEKADYVLEYKGVKLAVIEAKSNELEVGEGVMQAKKYAAKLQLDTAYSANGKSIYQICMKTGEEGLVPDFLSPEALWHKTYAAEERLSAEQRREAEAWREKFAAVPYENKGSWSPRYYQEIATQRVMEAIAHNTNRILLTLATGTGKTAIAFQIAWKLFQTRWNLKRDGSRRPRILFLADRNILADQAYNAFSAFAEDALVRIRPDEIKKKGRPPTNGSIFFTIFQTFMSGPTVEGKKTPYFGEYPQDYFDFIVIDECHRGGADNESTWRDILEYFSPAVQLGLTATPKRKDNVDTYKYFGEPVYVYSLKEGINDGFLTPFKVKRIKTTLDDYIYAPDDTVEEGDVEEGRLYEEKDFNRIIEIEAREEERVKIFLSHSNQNEKAIVFCANQAHAALIRDLISQNAGVKNTNYCVRVTANDGKDGEQFLRAFQDNEKLIPTILTTSHKLSTGVDARNIRAIVLLRPIKSMIEFKQIIGRGSRLYDGKEFFTIYDFVDAHKHFIDPEWDGDAIDDPVGGDGPSKVRSLGIPPDPQERKQKIKIILRDGKEREIQHMVSTSFWNADGKPVSTEEFLNKLFGELPKLFKNEKELRTLWSIPSTRKKMLEELDAAGFPKADLITLQKLVDMEKSDLYDVLAYVFNGRYVAMTREARAKAAEATIFSTLDGKQKEFISFVLSKYVEIGVEELSQEKLEILLRNKYGSLEDAKETLGDDTKEIRNLFIKVQEYLYQQEAA